MEQIKCPKDLNKFLIQPPVFENTFHGEECECAQFYGDCYHCWQTAITCRDQQEAKRRNANVGQKVGKWIHLLNGSGNVECTECGVEQPIDSYYCPWCGAKMEGIE